jgi:carbonic anhydrase
MRTILLSLATLPLAIAWDDRASDHSGTDPATGEVEVVAEDAHESAAEHSSYWDYGDEAGPAQWGSLNPDFALCDEGMQQSPVDLIPALAEHDEVKVRRNFQPVKVQVSFQESTVNVLDNGHTIQVSFEAGNTVDVGDKSFALAQYHFHAPSEHTLNGRHFPMEVHFVHSTDGGELAVVGVFIEQGEHNAAFDPVWGIMPRKPGESRLLEGQDVDLDALVPKGIGAFRYGGSLTTPPCSEGVRWFVRQDPIALSAEQITAFTDIINNNNRPVQPLNGRELAFDRVTYVE